MCRVRDFEVIDSYPFGVEITWEKDGAPHTETLFKRAGPIPSSKMLTFFRYTYVSCTSCKHTVMLCLYGWFWLDLVSVMGKSLQP